MNGKFFLIGMIHCYMGLDSPYVELIKAEKWQPTDRDIKLVGVSGKLGM